MNDLEKPSEMPDRIFHCIDNIDAAMFSSDSFIKSENRKCLKAYMKRWERELKVWEETEKEVAEMEAKEELEEMRKEAQEFGAD